MKFDPSLPEEGANVTPTNPLRDLVVLVAGVAGAGVLAVVLLAASVELVVPRLPIGVEGWIFPSWLGPEDAGQDVHPRGALLAPLLERLTRHWPENPYEDLRVGVLESESPNALALPGGSILVTTALLGAVESENELAFVLGHELGHFRHRDHLRGLGRGLALSLVFTALTAAGAGSASQIAGLAGQLTGRSFDREQEQRADRFGMEIVVAEYGHIAGIEDFFERIPDPEGGNAGKLAGYLSTHPLDEDRKTDLRRAAGEAGWPVSGSVRRID